MELQAWWQLRAKLGFDFFLDLVDNRYGVGVGDFDDTDTDRGFTIKTSQLAIVGQSVDHFGDILQADWPAVFPADHHLFQGINAVKLKIKFDQTFSFFADHKTAR